MPYCGQLFGKAVLQCLSQQQGLTAKSHQSGGTQPGPASALFASPNQASATPARPMLNFFSACRRVTDWANPLASSSNLLFMGFFSFLVFVCCACESTPGAGPAYDAVIGGEVNQDGCSALLFRRGHRIAFRARRPGK